MRVLARILLLVVLGGCSMSAASQPLSPEDQTIQALPPAIRGNGIDPIYEDYHLQGAFQLQLTLEGMQREIMSMYSVRTTYTHVFGLDEKCDRLGNQVLMETTYYLVVKPRSHKATVYLAVRNQNPVMDVIATDNEQQLHIVLPESTDLEELKRHFEAKYKLKLEVIDQTDDAVSMMGLVECQLRQNFSVSEAITIITSSDTGGVVTTAEGFVNYVLSYIPEGGNAQLEKSFFGHNIEMQNKGRPQLYIVFDVGEIDIEMLEKILAQLNVELVK